MSFHIVKRCLKHAKKHGCTIDMLYLKDKKIVLQSMEDMSGYRGSVISCLEIVEELSNQNTHVGIAKTMNKEYGIRMDHVHLCVAIYLGKSGLMDLDYDRKYPNSKLSSLGTTLIEYESRVKDTMCLAELILDMKYIQDYNLDSFSVICNFFSSLDLEKTFKNVTPGADIVLYYDSLNSDFIAYSGNTTNIQRKISTNIEKNIPKRYVEFNPKSMDRNGVIMAKWGGRDFKIYREGLIFDCDGENLRNIGIYCDEVISIFRLDGRNVGNPVRKNTKASFSVELSKWSSVVMEDIITNNKTFSRLVTISNGIMEDYLNLETLQRNRRLICLVHHLQTKCIFRYSDNNLIVSVIALSVDEYTVTSSIALMSCLLDVYYEKFDEIYPKYFPNVHRSSKKKSGKYRSAISDLRDRLPEFFTNNYTRECHHLPIMLDTEEEAKEYIKMGRLVLKYPLEGKYSRWYTSPSDKLYVGLKINRLANKDVFKHLVTCYTSNHYDSPGRETFMYYRGNKRRKKETKEQLKTLRILTLGRTGPLPTPLTMEYGLEGYYRVGTGGSFVGCLSQALGFDLDDLSKKISSNINKGLLNVVRQELWNKSGNEILNGLDFKNLDGVMYYRIFEELYECNIFIIEIGQRNRYNISIPNCKGNYIWEPYQANKYVVIVKNTRKLYDDIITSYELVIRSGKSVFRIKDPLVSAVMSFKLAHTVRSEVEEKDVKSQFITEYGKCNMVLIRNKVVKCNSRPLYKPIMANELVKHNSIMYNHLVKTNRQDLWVSSTSKYLYFPDDKSFHVWFM